MTPQNRSLNKTYVADLLYVENSKPWHKLHSPSTISASTVTALRFGNRPILEYESPGRWEMDWTL